MARSVPTGIPIPRVENTELQRFAELVANRLNQLDEETRRVAGTGGGGVVPGGTGGGIPSVPGGGGIPSIFGAPTLDTPPKPIGLEALGGIGIVMLSWANPFRQYANHGLTTVYRNTVDQFDTAANVGTSSWAIFTDETVEDETEYFYWVRFTSTSNVEGPVSDSVSVTSALDPAEVYAQIEEWLDSSPLLALLTSPIQPITDAALIAEEIRRLAATVPLLVAGAAEAAEETATAAQTAADSAVTVAGTASTAAAAASTAASAAQTTAAAAQTAANSAATTAGTAQTAADAAQTAADSAQSTADSAVTAAGNAQTAADAAKTAADTAQSTADTAKTTADTAKTTADTASASAGTAISQSLTALNSANAAQTSANQALVHASDIAADIGTLARADELVVYISGQNRNDRFNAAFVEGGSVEIGTHATTTTDDITVEVYSKTDTDQGPGTGNSHLYELLLEPDLIDWTAGTLYIRNTGTAFDLTQANLQTDVDDVNADEHWLIDEDVARFPVVTQINAVNTTLAGKADASALTALDTRITANTDGITTHTAQITSLEARLVSQNLGPETNEFSGNTRAEAETARDTYFTANDAKLQQYNADTGLNIRLTWGVLRVFQNRVNTADESDPAVYEWRDNGEVEPTAAAITTLNATVNQQGMAIAANTSNITSLTTTVGTKADASALATKADTTALTALTNRVVVNEGTIQSNLNNVALLEALIDGLVLGPPRNTFTGDDRASAEAARDTYFSANSDNLNAYDRDDGLHIRLLWDTTTQYQNRDAGVWTNVDADPRVGTKALTTLQTEVDANETDIATNTTNLTNLTTTVGTKADTSALMALTTRVTATEMATTTNTSSITALTTTVGNKADTTALDALTTRVTETEKGITANTENITSLTTTVGTKADTTALTTLTNRVTVNETSIEANAGELTRLEASLDGVTLGPTPNTFTGDNQAAAESARDMYTADTDNADWLTQYNGNNSLHIKLVYGTTTVYQRRSNKRQTMAGYRSGPEGIECCTDFTDDHGDREYNQPHHAKRADHFPDDRSRGQGGCLCIDEPDYAREHCRRHDYFTHRADHRTGGTSRIAESWA